MRRSLSLILVVSATLLGLASPASSAELSLAGGSLPEGQVGKSFFAALKATGGTTPYAWRIDNGALPAGLRFSAGQFSGTPTVAGSSPLTIRLTDAKANTVLANYTLTVRPMQIETATLPDGQTAKAYSAAMKATGGTAPYKWTITSGTLPAGLKFSTWGQFSGAPTVAGSSPLTIRLTDSKARTAVATYTLTVKPMQIDTPALKVGTRGVPYSLALKASGGKAPYKWSLTSGALPAGLKLSYGQISGTPTSVGSSALTLTVIDGLGQTLSRSYTLAVATKIIFVTNQSGKKRINVMNADGSGRTDLNLGESEREQDPTWSPDGTKIAFTRITSASSFVHVANANGSGMKKLASGYQPQWSSDGSRIAFLRAVRVGIDYVPRRYVINADGTNEHEFNDADLSATPALSPDGTKVLVSRDLGPSYSQLFVKDIATLTEINVSNNTEDDRVGFWSPDGTKIGFLRYISGSSYWVYVMDSDGSGQTRLSNVATANDRHSPPVWSPDGSRVLFFHHPYGPGSEIYVVNADATNLNRLATTGRIYYEDAPSWSPGGSRIMWGGGNADSGNRSIFTMDPDGSNQTRLTSSAIFAYQPEWAPK